MKAGRAIVLSAAAVLVVSLAKSGHELPVYPSYYPHEIEIKTIAPQQAADLMRAGELHAYVGGAPIFAQAPPDTISAANSLGALVVVRLNPDSPLARDPAAGCAATAAIVRDMATRAGRGAFTAHPYPVTPWHGDYINHVDRADEARRRLLTGDAPLPADIKVRADSELVRGLVRPAWLAEKSPHDATVEEIDVAGFVADATFALNGWLGPRWVRSGWFHAYRVLGSSLRDPVERTKVQEHVARLQAVDYRGSVERINLERELVQSLASDCHAAIAGYTVKREYFNTQFSAGIENISFDAIEGFNSPMFLRTAKLKDFPWNGSLWLGIEARPDAAWNPIGGFTGPFGRLAWYAIADPAVIPSPYEATWTLNRISDVEISPGR
jgi:hypothetical protein